MAEFTTKELERRRVTAPAGGETMTKQSMAAEVDINNIIKRWLRTGVAPVTGQKPLYGDFTGMVDFHSAMNRIRTAEADFMALPSAVRKHVDNDPGKFLEMVYDPERHDELVELGLVPDRDPTVTESVTPPVPPPANEG